MTDDAEPTEPTEPTEPAAAGTAPAAHGPASAETRRAALWSAAEARGVPLRAILATIVAVIVFYLAGKVIYRLRDVILIIIVAGFIALLLNPLVIFAQRKVGRRGLAVAIVTLLAVVFFAGLAVAFGYPLVNGITHLADDLPRYVSKAEHGQGWIGHLVTRYHVQNWVKTNAPKLASYGKDIANPVIIAGLVVLVTLLILGVPFPFLWALWVALVDFLPMVGGALAGIPVVLFALTQSLSAGIVTLIVFLVYTQVENHILNPVIMSRTVRINPLLVLVSILVGASLGSLVGGIFGGFVVALLSIPLAGALQVIVSEVWRSTDPAHADPADADPAHADLAHAGAGTAGSQAVGSVRPAVAGAAAGGGRRARWAVPRRPHPRRVRLGPRRPDSAQKPPAQKPPA